VNYENQTSPQEEKTEKFFMPERQHSRKNVYQHQVSIQDHRIRPEGLLIIFVQSDPFQLVGKLLREKKKKSQSGFHLVKLMEFVFWHHATTASILSEKQSKIFF